MQSCQQTTQQGVTHCPQHAAQPAGRILSAVCLAETNHGVKLVPAVNWLVKLIMQVKGDTTLLNTLLTPPGTYAHGQSVLDSIVKVYTVHSRPNHFLPWQNHPKRESTGTGWVVHDRLILTNAHVVADSTYVLVKRHGSGTKYKANVQVCVWHPGGCACVVLALTPGCNSEGWCMHVCVGTMPWHFGPLSTLPLAACIWA